MKLSKDNTKEKIDDINEGENEDSYFWSNALKKYKSLI